MFGVVGGCAFLSHVMELYRQRVVQTPVWRNRQTGAALIEFAFVLLPLLLLTVGTLLYGLVFVTQQAMAFAAQRGADAIVQVNPEPFSKHGKLVDVAGYCAAGQMLAENRVEDVLPSVALLSAQTEVQPVTPAGAGRIKGCKVTVISDFPLNIPLLPLPEQIKGVGFVPATG